jgi:hypothetical protein
MDEDLKRVIEDLHVVSSVRFHGDKTHKAGIRLIKPPQCVFTGIRLIKQASMPTSGVLQRLHMEDAARNWWDPSACRPNFLRCVTAYANLDD